MKTRDKLFLMIVGAAAILVAAWMLVVSPERQKASALSGQVTQAQQRLDTATASVASARAAQLQYPKAYATVVTLGKAVPPGDDTASLVYQLAQASHTKGDDFSSIAEGGAGATGPGAAPAPTAPAGSSVGAASFQAKPFSLHFNGSFFSLYHLLDRLSGFTLQSANGAMQVSGRLLTIDGASLDLGTAATAGTGTAGAKPSELSGTLTVTAYVLPAQQSLTAGATAASPTGAPAASASSSSPATPAAAVARVTP